MKMAFTTENFREASLDIIKKADGILTSYAAQGLTLSLRQVYYAFVSRNWLANKEENYKRLGDIVSRARMAGLLDWEAIEDRGRMVNKNNWWNSPSDILDAVARQFHLDLWQDQPNYVLVMIEKNALAGVVRPVCLDEDVRFTANVGYASATHLYEIGRDLHEKSRYDGRVPHVIYLGDHDPSGIDMTRDVEDRLRLFAGRRVHVHRIALNMDQIEQYEPPPNPAKETDSRFRGYQDLHGDESWELDALEPSLLATLVRETIVSLRDEDLYQAQIAKQTAMRADLKRMADEYVYEDGPTINQDTLEEEEE